MMKELLHLLNMNDDLQKRYLNQLNNAIGGGVRQLDAGEKIASEESYKRLRKKIKAVAKDK